MRNLLTIATIAIIYLNSCSNQTISDDIIWTIRKETTDNNIGKCNLEISINKKVDEQVLTEIANELKHDRPQYSKLWIFYYLDGMESTTAWAITHFTPNLEVEIMGTTESEDIDNKDISEIPGEIVGQWRSDKSLSGATLTLFIDSAQKNIMRIRFSKESEMDSEVKRSDMNGIIEYRDNNAHGEYYRVEPNGNLGMYGENGKFDEAVRLK